MPPGLGAGGVIFYAALLKAESLAPTRIRATFSNPVRKGDGTRKGSGLNPANYTLEAVTPGITAPALVAAIEDDPSALTTTVLATLEPLVSGATYQLRAGSVRTENGVPVPNVARQFLGVGFAAPDPDPTESEATGLDIDDTTDDGDWQLGPDGDVKLHSGLPMISKLIVRRISTAPGAFRHLPTYGLSIDIARLVTSAELRRVQDGIGKQVLLEPDVLTAKTRVALDQKGVLAVTVKATTRRGQTFTLDALRS